MEYTITIPRRIDLTTTDYRSISKGVIEDLLKHDAYAGVADQRDACITDLSETLLLFDQPEVDQATIAKIQRHRVENLAQQLGSLPKNFASLPQTEVTQMDTVQLLPYASLVFDSLAFIGDLCGLDFPRLSGGILKALIDWVSQCWDGVCAFLTGLQATIKMWIQGQRANQIIYAFFGAVYILYKRTRIGNALGFIFVGLPGWDRFWSVAKFTGMLILLVVSAGGEAILRAMRSVAKLVNVIADLLTIQKRDDAVVRVALG